MIIHMYNVSKSRNGAHITKCFSPQYMTTQFLCLQLEGLMSAKTR